MKRTVIAEIVGPSGAGKSHLSTILNVLDAGVKAGLTVWGLPRTNLASSGLRSMRELASLAYDRRNLRTSEVKQVIRLAAFYRMLNSGRFDLFRYIFLDEGVVFALAKLRADIGFDSFGGHMKRWESGVIDRWSSLLDLIVWLDASDEVLMRRIRTRAKHHRIKHEADETMREFLGRYRAAYRSVLEEFAMRAEIPVLRFRTDDCDTQIIANEILVHCRHLAAQQEIAQARPECAAQRVSVQQRYR